MGFRTSENLPEIFQIYRALSSGFQLLRVHRHRGEIIKLSLIKILTKTCITTLSKQLSNHLYKNKRSNHMHVTIWRLVLAFTAAVEAPVKHWAGALLHCPTHHRRGHPRCAIICGVLVVSPMINLTFYKILKTPPSPLSSSLFCCLWTRGRYTGHHNKKHPQQSSATGCTTESIRSRLGVEYILVRGGTQVYTRR